MAILPRFGTAAFILVDNKKIGKPSRYQFSENKTWDIPQTKIISCGEYEGQDLFPNAKDTNISLKMLIIRTRLKLSSI
jgi:hypothetical protein